MLKRLNVLPKLRGPELDIVKKNYFVSGICLVLIWECKTTLEEHVIQQFSFPGEKKAQGLHNSLTGGCSQWCQTLFPGNKGQDERKPGEVQVGFWENLFTEKVVRHWHKLLRAMVDSSVLEVFKKCVNVAPGDMVNGEHGSAGLMAGLCDLGGLFQS
ncbi:hypothetical protein HGM15179_001842 [Zosterops borbonicus]|uniref:Uncharacterized protein n=1 Tax=Zosterops borbonicus TaxID=364589 RepID=A0A8K1LTN5_9PASS|nr:hypothetical protein HGM15179_001842 [Zosterops borbonicus]